MERVAEWLLTRAGIDSVLAFLVVQNQPEACDH